MPVRIQLKPSEDNLMPDHVVNVSDPGPWGNPFIVGVHGTEHECVELYDNLMAGILCTATDNFIAQRSSYRYMVKYIQTLQGKDLACWCPLDQPCHADVLIGLANPAGCP